MDARSRLLWMFDAAGGRRMIVCARRPWILVFCEWVSAKAAADPRIRELVLLADREAVAELLAAGWRTLLSPAPRGGVKQAWQRGRVVFGDGGRDPSRN